MATVTSLTEDKIQELVSGWEGVSLSQDELNALVSQLWVDNESHDAALTEFKNVTVPELADDVAAGSTKVSDLNDVTIPDLEAQLSAHDLNLTNLNTVELPLLGDRVHSNELWIIDLNETILPALYARLDTNDASVAELNTVTLPALNTRLTDLESGGGVDTTALEARLGDLEGKFPITGPDISADAITANHIGADQITASEIATGTITALEIAADTITANEIASRTITALELMADTITANEIATDTITANEIATDAITANEIAGRTITAAEIAVDAITANEIATDAITANEIAGRTITAAEIAVDAITANEIATDTITANEIATDAITANEIAGKTITAAEIAAGTITAAEVATDILVTNSLYSREGYIGKIEAQQINSGSMTAEIGVLGKLQVGLISIDPVTGIMVPGPKGTTVLSATGGDHRWAGAVDTDEVNINGGLTLNAENNQINGTLKLANVVVAPPVRPTVTGPIWPFTTPIGSDTLSITDSIDGTEWISVYVAAGSGAAQYSIRKYNKVTGAKTAEYRSGVDFNADYLPYCISRIGNYYFSICWRKSTGYWALMRHTADFSGFSTINNAITTSSANPGMPACGPNLINGRIVVVYSATSGTDIRYQEYDNVANSSPVISQLWDNTDTDGVRWWPSSNMPGCTGVVRGNIGYDGTEELATVIGSEAKFWNTTTKALKWTPETEEYLKGICKTVDNKFIYLGYNTYRPYEWVTEAPWATYDPHTFKYSWYDSKLAGTGQHETTPSPGTVFGATRWAAYQVETAAPSNTGQDDSPDSVRIYADDKLQPALAVGQTKIVYRTLSTTGAPPKDVNEFVGAAAYPGGIVSEATLTGQPNNPRLRMRGDGTGNWGDLVVDGTGKATIGGDTGWVPITLFANLWENYGGTWATVAYRKVGSRVFLRGLIRPPGNVTGTMFTLPSGFRPPTDQLLAAAVQEFAHTFDATGDASKNTGAVNNSTTPHTHSISAYDIQTKVIQNNTSCRVDVLSTGEVKFLGGADYDTSTWISMFGLSFFVD
jgi:hypothetical protein